MKKNWLIMICFLLMALSLPAFAEYTADFRAEYMALNEQPTADGLHLNAVIDLPEDAPFAYATFDEVVALLKEGTGVVYFGYPECPWCRSLVPALDDAWRQSGYAERILCFNAKELRDALSLDENGTVVTEKEAAPEYETLVALLYDHLGPYEGLNDDSIRRIYFPTTVFVRGGEIVSVHLDTLEDQTDPYTALTGEQYDRLVAQLTAQINALS